MPRAKSVRDTVFDPMLLHLAGSEREGEEAIEAKVLAAFNQASKDDWVIAVSKWVKYSQPQEHCFDAPIDELKDIPARIARDWDPGTYIVRVKHNDKIAFEFRYAIAAPKNAGSAGVRSELGEFARTFQEALREQRSMFEGFLNRISQTPAVASGGGKQSSVTELVDALSKLDNLRSRGESKSDALSPEKIFEYVTLGLKIAGQRGGGGDKESSWGDILVGLANSDLAKKIGELATGGQLNARPALAGPGATAPPRTIAPPTEGPTGEGPTAASSPATADQVQQFMFHQIAYLLGRAAQWKASAMQKSHPDLYAEWVVDNFPPELLIPLATAPNLLEQLQAIVPEVGVYADWFLALFDSVRSELTEGGQLPDDGALANGAPNGQTPPHVSATGPASPSAIAEGQSGNP